MLTIDGQIYETLDEIEKRTGVRKYRLVHLEGFPVASFSKGDHKYYISGFDPTGKKTKKVINRVTRRFFLSSNYCKEFKNWIDENGLEISNISNYHKFTLYKHIDEFGTIGFEFGPYTKKHYIYIELKAELSAFKKTTHRPSFLSEDWYKNQHVNAFFFNTDDENIIRNGIRDDKTAQLWRDEYDL